MRQRVIVEKRLIMSSEGPYGRQGYSYGGGAGGSYSSAPGSGGSGGYGAPGYNGQQPVYGGGYNAPPANSYGGAQYGQQVPLDAYQVRESLSICNCNLRRKRGRNKRHCRPNMLLARFYFC